MFRMNRTRAFHRETPVTFLETPKLFDSCQVMDLSVTCRGITTAKKTTFYILVAIHQHSTLLILSDVVSGPPKKSHRWQKASL